MRLFFITSVIFFLSTSGCDPDLVDNTRVLVKGRVVNFEGEPINDVLVLSEINACCNYDLGVGETRGNGEFELTSFYSNIEFSIYIRDEGFSKYRRVYFSTEPIPENLTFDLGEIVLRRTALLNLKVTRDENSSHELRYSLSYIEPICEEFFEDPESVSDISFCYPERSLTRVLNDVNPNSEILDLPVLYGETLQFIYSINGGEEIIEEIIIDENEIEFEFNY